MRAARSSASHAACLLLIMLTGLLSGSETSGLSHPPDKILESIYRVYMAAGDTTFRLGVSYETPEGVDEAIFVRVASAAACLEYPHDLPMVIDLRPDPEFVARLGRVRSDLRRLVDGIELRHREDPDYDGSFSTALRDALQDAVVPILRKEGVFRQVGEAHQRDRGNPDSCMARLAAYVLAPPDPVPEAEQWREVMDVCTGPQDSVGKHIVYHFTAEGVAPDRRDAILRLSGAPGFRECLVRIIKSEPGIESQVLSFDGGTSYRDAIGIRRAVHDLWEEYGLATAIEEASKAGAPGEAFYRFLKRCADLPQGHVGPREKDVPL